jgi:hypothetical protein
MRSKWVLGARMTGTAGAGARRGVGIRGVRGAAAKLTGVVPCTPALLPRRLRRENVLLVATPMHPGYRYNWDARIFEKEYAAPGSSPLGSGYGLLQLTWPGETFVVGPEGAPEPLDTPALDMLQVGGAGGPCGAEAMWACAVEEGVTVEEELSRRGARGKSKGGAWLAGWLAGWRVHHVRVLS